MKAIGKKKINTKLRLFTSCVLIFLIPYVLVSVTLGEWIISKKKEDIRENYMNKLANIRMSIDKQFEQLDCYVTMLSESRITRKLIYLPGNSIDLKQLDPFSISDYNQQIFLYYASNYFIEKMDVIFNTKNFVFTGDALVPDINLYFSFIFKNREDIDSIKGLINTKGTKKIIYPVNMYNQSNGFIYIATLPSEDINKVRASIIFTINTDCIKNTVNYMLPPDEGTVIITDYQNNIICGNGVNSERDRKLLAQCEPDTNSQCIIVDEQKLIIFRERSMENDLFYNFIIAEDVLYSDIWPVINFYILLAGLIFIVGVFFALFFTYKYYKPAKHILGLIEEAIQYKNKNTIKEPIRDEYEFINYSLKSIINLQRSLENKLKIHYPQLLQYYLKMIIEDNYSNLSEIEQQLNELDISFPFKYFVSIIVMSDKDLEQIKIDMDQRLSGMDQMNFYFVKYKEYICMIVNFNDKEKIKECLDDLLSSVFLKYLKVFCGVGREYSSIGYVSKSYREALFAANYYLTREKPLIIFYDNIRDGIDYYNYPIHVEYNIVNCLKNGDILETKKIVDNLMQSNIQQRYSTSNAIRNFFFNIYLTGLRTVSELELEIKAVRDYSNIFFTNEIYNMYNVVMDLFKEICNHVKEKKTTSQDLLAMEIASYINNNYNNPELSLSIIADYFGLSISYISRCFNDHFKTSFLSYLNQVRIEKAKDLLINTTYSIKEIAVLAGYNNTMTLNRCFKKYVGISPGEFRSIEKQVRIC